MNVRELKEALSRYPDYMDVLTNSWSDYRIISADDLEVVQGVDQGDWVMRSHQTMSEENRLREKSYLLL